MADWSRTTKIEPSYFEVDPSTWADVRRVDGVTACSITRSVETPTLERANLSIDTFDMGERWIRCYVTVTQDGVAERLPVGCWLVQTPSRSVDGMFSTVQVAAFSSLHPLSEAKAPLGTCFAPGTNCAEAAAAICREHGVAPVVDAVSDAVLDDWYTVPKNTSWLSVANTLAGAAKSRLTPDSVGRVCIVPIQPTMTLRPLWAFEEGDGSLLLPSASEQRDWYGLYNVCRVYADDANGNPIQGVAVNDDPTSELSTVRRGREVTLEIDHPDELKAGATHAAADLYARRALLESSAVKRIVTVRHGMVPTNLWDCIHVGYQSMALDADAVVTDQRITVTETDVEYEDVAVSTEQLWEA